MNARYRYCLDPVFFTAAALYLLNRWVFKPFTSDHTAFFASYFNDLLCIPLWLPLCLQLYRKVGVRWHDRPPTPFEVLSHLAVWSLCFEWLLPSLRGPFSLAVKDSWDVLAYAVGAAVAGRYWGTWHRQRDHDGFTALTEPNHAS